MPQYCTSRFQAKRWPTQEVCIGTIGVGGINPIRIQSMTNTSTLDISSTVKQVLELAETGCEIVRITVPNIKSTQALAQISKLVRRAKCPVPLVADIHFLPQVAMEAARHVAKVRINPGNYADRKKIIPKQYSEEEYEQELDQLHQRFSPLVRRCQEEGCAMRIGVNSGSLSQRIMHRYGATPLGMVQSAIEFIHIAEAHNFTQVVLSMKSSNPRTMIYAYRLLASTMTELNMAYPMHVGLTEAGDGVDARIKSSIGIGALLCDGIGDTIRVSLTENPVKEILVAKNLVSRAHVNWIKGEKDRQHVLPDATSNIDPYSYTRRYAPTIKISDTYSVSSEDPPRVLVPINTTLSNYPAIISSILKAQSNDKERKIEGIVISINTHEDLDSLSQIQEIVIPTIPCIVLEICSRVTMKMLDAFPWSDRLSWMICPYFATHDYNTLNLYIEFAQKKNLCLVIDLSIAKLRTLLQCFKSDSLPKLMFTLTKPEPYMHAVGSYRALEQFLYVNKISSSIWLRNTISNQILPRSGFNETLIESSIFSGSLLCDGIGDIISIETGLTPEQANGLSYDILQGSRLRSTKTEYIACPGCGRTLFDLETTTQVIRSHTKHLKGVTIAVMGCIVNGPGEMAYADFGYVGGAPGKVNLYVKTKCISYNIPEKDAVNRLIQLIQKYGKWIEPPQTNNVI